MADQSLNQSKSPQSPQNQSGMSKFAWYSRLFSGSQSQLPIPPNQTLITSSDSTSSEGDSPKPQEDGKASPRSFLSRSLLNTSLTSSSEDLKKASALGKDFWMKDEEVKFCYDCQSPFSAMLRRHHCRFCGQIFCWRCSQNSLKSIENPLKLIRACNVCYHRAMKVAASPVRSSSASKLDLSSPTYAESELYDQPNEEEEGRTYLKLFSSSQDSYLGPTSLLKSLETTYTSSSQLVGPNNRKKLRVDNVGEIEADPQAPELPDDVLPDDISIMPGSSLSIANKDDFLDEKISLERTTQAGFSRDNVGQVLKEPTLVLSRDSSTENVSLNTSPEKMLREATANYLLSIVTQLVQTEGLDTIWIDRILELVDKAISTVEPGEEMDLLNYTKVKVIPEGSIHECEYINGICFTKNLLHKKMRSDISQPRILLFDCAIEFQRNRLLVIDDVLAQERSHLKNLVNRIAALKPDLVLVSKTVSRLAQEFLFENGISVAQCVKSRVIRRLSRVMGSEIIISPTDVVDPTMGTCGRFYVKTYRGSFSPKPLLFLIETPPRLGCTILLRGDTRDVLRRVKKVLLFGIFTANNLRLEKSLYIDERATFGPEFIEKSKNGSRSTLLSCSVNLMFPTRNSRSTSDNFDFFLPSSITQSPELNPFVVKVTTQFGPAGTIAEEATNVPADVMDFLKSRYADEETIQVVDNVPARTIFDHQKILYIYSTFCRNTSKQCVPYRMHYIDYYKKNDITLGQFLETRCFEDKEVCENTLCSHRMMDHDRSFVHGSHRVNLTVYRQDTKRLIGGNSEETFGFGVQRLLDQSLHFMRQYCNKCKSMTPITPMKLETFNYSFGKFLELAFYGNDVCHSDTGCNHSLHRDFTRYFFWNNMVAVFYYEPLRVCETVLPMMSLPPDDAEIDDDKVSDVLEAMSEFYEVLFNRLSQLEADWKGSQEILQLQKKSQAEKQHTFKELDLLKGSEVSLIKLGTLEKHFYDCVAAWESVINEHVVALRRKRAPTVIPAVITTAIEEKGTPSANLRNSGQVALTGSGKFNKASDRDSPVIDTSSRVRSMNVSVVLSPKFRRKDERVMKPTILAAIRAISSYLSNGGNHPIALSFGVNQKRVCLIYEEEPTTLIAHTLGSLEYAEQFNYISKACKETYALENKIQISEAPEEDLIRAFMLSREKSDIKNTFKYETMNSRVTMSCTTYYSHQFSALRKTYCGGDESFIQSLSRCKGLDASGGKSGATFSKTLDGRYIVKRVSQIELECFIEIGHLYFEYLANSIFQQVATILAKILGVFTLRSDNVLGGQPRHLIVMENIFLGVDVGQTFDLKGSKRNRYTKDPGEDQVRLDENLLEVMFTAPFWVDGHSKSTLQAALWNDTLFLSSLGIIDYSLLVAYSKTKNQIVVGIIDYIRQYTWDKQLETWVKTVGSGGRVPTVISPRQYKLRFREAMTLYFVHIPDKSSNIKSIVAPSMSRTNTE